MNNIRTYITVGALCSAMTISAQDHRISGTVSDEFGPVIGCNVIEKDANNRNVNATITDVNGNFQLAIKNPKNKLVVSYVGYKTFHRSSVRRPISWYSSRTPTSWEQSP